MFVDRILETFMVLHKTKTVLFFLILFQYWVTVEPCQYKWNIQTQWAGFAVFLHNIYFWYFHPTVTFLDVCLFTVFFSHQLAGMTEKQKTWEMKNFYFYTKNPMEICGWTLRRGCLLRKISNIKDNSIYTCLTTVNLDDSQWFVHEHQGH